MTRAFISKLSMQRLHAKHFAAAKKTARALHMHGLFRYSIKRRRHDSAS
jgi:hypothetical protein